MRVVNDRRVKPRVALRGGAVVYAAREQFHCHCVDVSAGGIALLGPRAARIRERVVVETQFGTLPFRGGAIVVRGRKTPHGYLWGLRFIDLDTQLRESLERYVEQSLAVAARIRQARLFGAGRPLPPPQRAVDGAALSASVPGSPFRVGNGGAPSQRPAHDDDSPAAGVETPAYATRRQAEDAPRRLPQGPASPAAPLFDPSVSEDPTLLEREEAAFDGGGGDETLSSIPHRSNGSKAPVSQRSSVASLDDTMLPDVDDALEASPRTTDMDIVSIAEPIHDEDPVDEPDQQVGAEPFGEGPGAVTARIRLGTVRDRRTTTSHPSTTRRPGLGPVSPVAFDEDADTNEVRRPSLSPSFDEWERQAALPSSAMDEPRFDGIRDEDLATGVHFGWSEPGLYGGSSGPAEWGGAPAHKTPSPKVRAPVLLDGSEEIPDVDAPIFGEIADATGPLASADNASSRDDGIDALEEVDETDVRRGADTGQFTPVGSFPQLEVTQRTGVRSRARPAEPGPLSYSVVPLYEREPDSAEAPTNALGPKSGFTVVASMEELGLQSPRSMPRAGAARPDVGDYAVVPQYEPGENQASGFTMVASPDSWDVPLPEPSGGSLGRPTTGPTTPDVAFDEHRTRLQASGSFPGKSGPAGPTTPHPVLSARPASRQLVEQALAQLRAKSEAKRKRTGPQADEEAAKERAAAEQRERRRQRRVERIDSGQIRIRELFRAAVADLDEGHEP